MTTPSTLPTTIRGVIQPDPQSTTLQIRNDLPMPEPNFSNGEHLIRVHATSPCSGELLWARDHPSLLTSGKSLVPCYDLAGVVISAPSDSKFPPGTEIWTRTTAWRTGNAREYTIALADELSRKPPSLTWEQATSIPLSGFTAWQALFDKGCLALGWKSEDARKANAAKSVLVTAAAGGVGVITLQLARAAGVGRIIAQTSTKNVDFVKSLGATEVVDYRQQSLTAWADTCAEKVDVVLDMIGGDTLDGCWQCVKDDGVVLSIRDTDVEARRPQGKERVKAEFFIMQSYGWQLDEVAALVGRGEVKPIVDSIWKLEEFEKAFEIVDGAHSRGKVILRVSDELCSR